MAKQQDADVAFIEALARLLRKHDLSEIEVAREEGEDRDLKVRLSRQPTAPAAPALAANPPPAAAPAASTPAPAAPKPTPEDPAQHPGAVTSPMVGTVYLAAEPGAPNFVKIGDRVSEGQTLLIVEAMKTMNQIPAPRAGVVKRIMVEDGQAVEFGAPLVIIE
ncbi:acetyl-CoA carboxylase biotin carboxyl carrier protein [Pikeienuella piscinae]|uniref:Biotin carboxyl carrier protein of acetyl-CoA carboxylase n=1 Tax=Pikeienuella piscinae TaxID=2748098 RepID=A0A7L5BTA8_9RHOB|nr:acetyl-CoA carboxylase biotin carboxyl carrier protein [Pikeienuella piscinae]QIE54562.1 acetyl-CoA carboxylase biotin carboxyl carrier protein [Pikeienuella piscinae]